MVETDEWVVKGFNIVKYVRPKFANITQTLTETTTTKKKTWFGEWDLTIPRKTTTPRKLVISSFLKTIDYNNWISLAQKNETLFGERNFMILRRTTTPR